MNVTERACHPSRLQVETLIDFIEGNPNLVKGFSKKCDIKMWEKLALQLNTLHGCVKTWKQWSKYWADKKCAVKKKGALRLHTSCEAKFIELSDTEERILALMSDKRFALGGRQLETNLLQEQHITQNIMFTDTKLPAAKIQQQPIQYIIEYVHETSHSPRLPSPVDLMSEGTVLRTPSPVNIISRDSTASPEMSAAPSISGRHPQRRTLNVFRQQASPTEIRNHPNTAATNRRRRPTKRFSPASQKYSDLNNLTERFLQLEEQRIQIYKQNSQIFATFVNNEIERNRTTAQALLAIGDGFKLLAEALNK